MTTARKIGNLIASLEEAVKAGLAYFEEHEDDTEVRVGHWRAEDVLRHMIFWHEATVKGMQSVASGGQPYRIYASTDEMNARAVGRLISNSMAQLIAEMRGLQKQLVTGVRALADPNVTVLVRGDGSEATALQRLEVIAHHWREHIQELQG